MSNVRYWLWFIMAFGAGNERIWEITGFFRDVTKAYEAVCDAAHSSLSANEKKRILSTHIEQCDSIINYCDDNGYRIITIEDENYPPLLRNICNPPAVLFCMGNIENFIGRPSVTCVGTRKPSVYSADVTERICSELVAREFAIVSGFALGLDSAAHKAALLQGGCTVAVLACGIDVNYPKENEQAKKQIAVNGAVITEYLPGTRPDRYCFHKRNRILSGLCFGTLVTEADEQSGALITAAHAAEQGRTVFCIPPGDIFDKRYQGVVKYLRDGAVPVFSHLDILYDYYLLRNYENDDYSFDWPQICNQDDIPHRDSRTPKRKKTVKSKSPASDNKDGQTGESKRQWEQFYEEMDNDQKAVIDCMSSGEKHPDELSQMLGMDAFAIMAVMTELEMIGAAELLPNHKYRLC